MNGRLSGLWLGAWGPKLCAPLCSGLPLAPWSPSVRVSMTVPFLCPDEWVPPSPGSPLPAGRDSGQLCGMSLTTVLAHGSWGPKVFPGASLV